MNPNTLPFRPRRERETLEGLSPTKTQDSRSQMACRFYQRGLCRNGHACPYRHQDQEDIAPQDHAQPAEEKVTRTISGTLVHFDAGAAVTKFTRLPQGITPASVLNLLRSRAVDTSMTSPIRVIPGEPYASARVEAEDPYFADSVVAKFGQWATSHSDIGVSAARIPVDTFSGSDSSALRVDCKKVHCSWHKPSKTVWLNFGDDKIAKRVSDKFRKGEYRILDQMTHPTHPERGAGVHNPRAWTVCLTDVPSGATEADILRSIRSEGDRPRGIQIGKPTYATDAETCASKIQSLFTAIGPLEWWEFTLDTTGKRMKASARFSKEEDAKSAKTAKLTVQLVYTARFKYLHFTVYDQPQPPKWYRTLKIEGEDGKNVAEAKNIISSILAGTVAKEGSSSLWQSSLRGNGEVFRKLVQLQRQSGVIILRNKAKSQLRLFGPPSKCEEVQTAISDIIKATRSNDFSIELDDDRYLWARLGGYKKLAAALGSDSVNLDITSTPKRIVIAGTASQYDIALSIMNDKVVQISEPDLNGQDCPACLTEAENPIRTRCGHTYCLDCFENLCLSAPTQDSPVKIRCVGSSGRCDTIVDLPQLQEHLSSNAFEELLEKSFASYTRLHPTILKHCPSPDCDYLYRANASVKVQTCSSCLVPICTSCHAQHEGLSCAEYQDVSSGRREANERLKKEIGIKDCPKCKTLLEKTEGCNHMTCRCGAHICWVCLGIFDSSSACYNHMNQEHGGIGLEHYQRIFG
ncbi:hypothetical protein F5Y14DRAFT_466334 [Nemania sp. NC0429]|nr:hypothetical protein F5Y14DRAFT_466334 [Nemania sp. NC0429]